MVVNTQCYPQGVPELVVPLVKAVALEPVQDVVDSGQVHHWIDGKEDPLAVEPLLFGHQRMRREHSADDKCNVPVINLLKGAPVNAMWDCQCAMQDELICAGRT